MAVSLNTKRMNKRGDAVRKRLSNARLNEAVIAEAIEWARKPGRRIGFARSSRVGQLAISKISI